MLKSIRIAIITTVSFILISFSSAILADEMSSADGAATDSSQQEETQSYKDPYEGFNRAMFWFNETVDKYLLKPIARGYNAVMPRPLNQGIHNFFLNIGNIPTIINDVLQLNFYQAANDTWRLAINTTVGIGGLFDIAGRIDLRPYKNDFGMTLARWGWENSNYLVLPFLGPSTPRDGIIGIPVDYYLFSVYPHIHPDRTRYALLGLFVIDRRAQLLQYQNVLDSAALDRYIFVRNAYLQNRKSQIQKNEHRTYADLGHLHGEEPVATAGGDDDTADEVSDNAA